MPQTMRLALKVDFDIRRTLEALEAQDWGPPNFGSHLVTTCHALRKKPLCDFTNEDLRIMINQNFSLPYLLPIAVQLLKLEPLAEGDYHAGDLLCSVLACDLKEDKNRSMYAFDWEEIASRALKSMEHDNSPSANDTRRDITLGMQKMAKLWKESTQTTK